MRRRFKNRLFLLVVIVGLFMFFYTANKDNRYNLLPAMSWALAHKVVVIDPGHGGPDPGAVGPGGTLEKDLTLAVARRLQMIFKQAGATVVMTRTEDKDLSQPGKSFSARKNEDLHNRLQLVMRSQADLYLNIQANSFGTTWTGAQTFYDPKDDENKRLAQCIQKEIRDNLRNTNRKEKELKPFMLRKLEIPAVLIEIGFISNPDEEKLLNNPLYQEKIAWAIFSGTVKYMVGKK